MFAWVAGGGVFVLCVCVSELSELKRVKGYGIYTKEDELSYAACSMATASLMSCEGRASRLMMGQHYVSNGDRLFMKPTFWILSHIGLLMRRTTSMLRMPL